MQKTPGGKTVYGASVGVLMLETRFPRIPGDIGNALSWPFPVQYRVVRGATPDNVVRGDPRSRLEDFIAAGRDLVEMGCDGIATNCGFLALLQREMAAELSVPVATSALMQVPMVQATLPPDRRVAILTISRETLGPAHLAAAGVPADTPVIGTDEGREFTRAVLGDEAEIDFAACRADLLDAAATLTAHHPETGAIVLECTNMVPYAADIRRQSGLPVYSIHSFLTWFQAGLMPRRFPGDLDDPRV
ncbi:aspartate/glutamate racemase family protein [Rhodophyticola porphyridii]|uniref:Aspartate/glutamate racemase family protein n=1 Tax=Rhodophyticola porphyridii TaxID=1852017 RepID=A0A3L9Y7J5_9RHOB|nr:aspartate/glutamate racemase family protein [Rhodophyticola porphyridii]RMA43057.1 aspartate/glutamate racemase family protein [Rhodophyticola porphyridii]